MWKIVCDQRPDWVVVKWTFNNEDVIQLDKVSRKKPLMTFESKVLAQRKADEINKHHREACFSTTVSVVEIEVENTLQAWADIILKK